MTEVLQLAIPKRMALARLILTLSFVVSVLLSFRLWAGSRSFPFAPVLDGFYLNAGLSMGLTLLAVLLLLSSVFLRWYRLLIFLALAVLCLLVFADINRLQPWVYVYGAMLLILVFYNGRVDDSNKFTSYFILLQVIVASVYFFCGISQLNAWFVDTEFANVIEPLKGFVSERQFLFFKRCGAVVPYLLMFTGVGLIFSPIRYLAISTAIILHLLLLYFLFPSHRHPNYALWFSNITYALLTIVLFSGKTKQRYFSPAVLFQMPLFYMVAFLFVLMPFFNRGGIWPDYLSSNFRSGTNERIVFKLSKETYKALPLFEKSFCRQQNGVYVLHCNKWCGLELNVDCNPELRVLKSIHRHLGSYENSLVKEKQMALASR